MKRQSVFLRPSAEPVAARVSEAALQTDAEEALLDDTRLKAELADVKKTAEKAGTAELGYYNHHHHYRHHYRHHYPCPTELADVKNELASLRHWIEAQGP